MNAAIVVKKYFIPSMRIELTTLGLLDPRSNQLSYEGIHQMLGGVLVMKLRQILQFRQQIPQPFQIRHDFFPPGAIPPDFPVLVIPTLYRYFLRESVCPSF